MSEDRRKKEWIMHRPKHNQQLSKIVKKKKKKVLAEHWLMHREEGKTHTEISLCKGCEDRLEQTIDKCEKWIRRDQNTKVVPELLIEKTNNRINATLEQLLENRRIKEWKRDEMELLELKPAEELEVELIKKQGLNSAITDQLIEILTWNKRRDKEKYIVYTDGALYKKRKENNIEKMGIG